MGSSQVLPFAATIHRSSAPLTSRSLPNFGSVLIFAVPLALYLVLVLASAVQCAATCPARAMVIAALLSVL